MKTITNLLEGILDVNLDVNVEPIEPAQQIPCEDAVDYYETIKGINEQITSGVLRDSLQKVVDAAAEYIKICTELKVHDRKIVIKNIAGINPEASYPQLTDWQNRRIDAYRIINDWLIKAAKLPDANKFLADGEFTTNSFKNRGIVEVFWTFYDDDPNIDEKFIEKLKHIDKRVEVKYSRAEDPIWYLKAIVYVK